MGVLRSTILNLILSLDFAGAETCKRRRDYFQYRWDSGLLRETSSAAESDLIRKVSIAAESVPGYYQDQQHRRSRSVGVRTLPCTGIEPFFRPSTLSCISALLSRLRISSSIEAIGVNPLENQILD